jgi:hypothetical protein
MFFIVYCWFEHIIVDEIVGVCGMYKRDAYKVFVESLKGIDLLEDLVVDGRMILKLIWKKYGDGVV